jgi:hypothetical protein
MSATTVFLPDQKSGLPKTANRSNSADGASACTPARFRKMYFEHWVSSRDELQAEQFINDCRNFANLF